MQKFINISLTLFTAIFNTKQDIFIRIILIFDQFLRQTMKMVQNDNTKAKLPYCSTFGHMISNLFACVNTSEYVQIMCEFKETPKRFNSVLLPLIKFQAAHKNGSTKFVLLISTLIFDKKFPQRNLIKNFILLLKYLISIKIRAPLIFAHLACAKIKGSKFAHHECEKIKGRRKNATNE